MKKMKSRNLKRLALSITLAISMSVFSAFPVLAAENNENTSTQTELQNSDLKSLMNSDTVEEKDITTSDISTLSNVSLYGGTETWYGGSALAGDYTFENYNLTPVKTMGQSGTLRISGNFYGSDGYAAVSPILLTVRIQSTSGTVLASTSINDSRSGSTPFSLSCHVSAGQKIQLFFDASSIANPPGIYREAHVTYYRYLY